MKDDNSIASRWLTLLGVRHTGWWTDRRFAAMPFQTLFGLGALLREYNIETAGYSIDNKDEIGQLPMPFLAPVDNRMVIVTSVADGTVHYNSAGVAESAPIADFAQAWDGVAFTAEPTGASCEPHYATHRLSSVMRRLSVIGLWAVAAFLFAWLVATRGVAHSGWAMAMVVLDLFGLWLSYLLIQKTLGVKSKHGDAVCAVLQPGGCDSIAKSDAATFLGIFHWSEVGFTYFSVSLLTLLIFPHLWGWLAVINACALPYTVWSISYQKFVAKTWCTMCVGVQLTLWAQFFVGLCAGWFRNIAPFGLDIVALGATYAFVMLALNRLDSFIIKYKQS